MNPAWSSRAHYLIAFQLKTDQIKNKANDELQRRAPGWIRIKFAESPIANQSNNGQAGYKIRPVSLAM